MGIRGKKGLSPVIATVLLVSLVVILAVIIFLWARAFIGEGVEKGGRDIDIACSEVEFDADAFSSEIVVVNTGNVPIWEFEIREKGGFGVEVIGQTSQSGNKNIKPGQTKNIELDENVEVGDELVIVPVLVGESEGTTKTKTCDEKFGVEVVVI